MVVIVDEGQGGQGGWKASDTPWGTLCGEGHVLFSEVPL